MKSTAVIGSLACDRAKRAEEGMTSDLNLFFDASAEDNLGIDGIYALGTGITRMFEKLALRHGSVPG